MSFHVHRVLNFEPLQEGENIIEFTSEPGPVAQLNNDTQPGRLNVCSSGKIFNLCIRFFGSFGKRLFVLFLLL